MDQWDLTYLFKTQDDFEKALVVLQEYIEKLSSYEGKLHEKENFKAYMLLNKEVDALLCKVYQYAHLRHDLNKRIRKTHKI